MGIDPGSVITGYGIVESRGAALHYVDSGAIKLPRGDVAGRLQVIFERLSDAMEAGRPDAVAVEQVFVARNARSALTLGQARGAALVACGRQCASLTEYSALQIKQALVGRGRADKTQVQHMVRVLLGLEQRPQPDAADALACAICHINHTRSRARYAAAMGAAR